MKNLQVEQPEKTKSSSTPSFSLLPDEITVNYLARIPRAYYPRLSTVSKSFKSILSSTEIYVQRSRLGTTEKCLYVSIWDSETDIVQWFRLWINPSPDSSMTIRQLLVPVPVSPLNESIKSVNVVVGSEIYAIGASIDGSPNSAVGVLDCRTHIWRDAPSMKVVRGFASSCFYDGKIYVVGGYKNSDVGWGEGFEDDEPWAEVFDVKTLTWEPLPEPGNEIRKCDIVGIAEIQGEIYGRSIDKVYAYDTKQGKWEHCGEPTVMFFRSKCVIENVSYSSSYWISWYDSKVGYWKKVKGLESLDEKLFFSHEIDSGSSTLVSCGGKLLLVWDELMNHSKEIWCAEIKVEKRDDGEVWGNVEWVDVVHTGARTCNFLRCLSVSV